MGPQPRGRTPAAALAVLLSLTSCAALRSWLAPPPAPVPEAPLSDGGLPGPTFDDAGVATPPLWLSGSLLRATLAAIEYETAHHVPARAPEQPAFDAWVRCMERIDTYDVQFLRDEPDRWVVFAVPRVARCEDAGWGGSMITGGATYEVRKADFRILSVQPWEG